MKHGKKYTDSAKLVDSQKLYDTAEALEHRPGHQRGQGR